MNSQARCVCDKDNEYGIVRKFSYCEICVKYERHVNVSMLVYKMQVRQGESLWSMLVKQTLSFFTFSYLKSVMSLNGLSLCLLDLQLQLRMSVLVVQEIQENKFPGSKQHYYDFVFSTQLPASC